MESKKIRVVLCEPGMAARQTEIGTGLKDLQRAVGGLIETYYPFDDEVCIVCNDEGKILGMDPCRAIYDDDRNVVDVICGPFFITGIKGDEFASLSEEQAERYTQQFKWPEMFFASGKTITAVPYAPDMGGPER